MHNGWEFMHVLPYLVYMALASAARAARGNAAAELAFTTRLSAPVPAGHAAAQPAASKQASSKGKAQASSSRSGSKGKAQPNDSSDGDINNGITSKGDDIEVQSAESG